MTEPVFLIGLAILATSGVMIGKFIAAAIGGRGASRSELAELREQLDQQSAALDEAHNGLANQAAQLAELQERVDFAERLLTQGREPNSLKPGS